jgi:Ca2+-binding RTX toxin-like protein
MVGSQYTSVIQNQLAHFAAQDNFGSILFTAFGDLFDANLALGFRQQWLTGDFSVIPPIEVLANGELAGAKGAYAAELDKIYISSDFLATAADEAITAVLLEEVGHRIDRLLNGNRDSAGDEGEIFSALARGIDLSAEALAALQVQNDHAVITVNGASIAVEENTFYGGSGNDTYGGSPNNDDVFGYGGNDTLSGGDGIDFIYGGDDNDSINGDNDIDFLFGEAGDDVLGGGDGDDGLYGGDGNDSLIGGVGDDFLSGGSGNDELWANFFGNGNDALSGGSGDDRYIFAGGNPSNITITELANDGTDTLFFLSVLTGPLNVDLSINTVQTISSGSTLSGSLDNIENITVNSDPFLFSGLGLASSILNGNALNNIIISGAGNDGISGGSGNDSLSGNDGDDFVSGGIGDDLVMGGNGDDYLFGDSFFFGNGNDTLDGGTGINTLGGGYGDDLYVIYNYTNGAAANTLGEDLNGGIDTISIIAAGINPISLDLSATATQTVAVGSTLAATSLANIENITLGAPPSVNAYLGGNNLNNVITGGDSDDILFGAGGRDTLIGGYGNDTYVVAAGVDSSGTVINDIDGNGEHLEIKVGNAYKPIIITDFQRFGTGLVYDLNGDQQFNAVNDLTILNFFASNTGNAAGAGLTESINGQFNQYGYNVIRNSKFKAVRTDLGNDEKSDIVWRNSSGEVYTYQMNGLSVASEASLGIVSNNWQIVGTSDFDGDSKADILWRNSVTGETYTWQMNGNTKINEGGIRTVSLDWQIAGTGDFNGDNKSDILWRNTSTGDSYLYQMNGLTTVGSEGLIRNVSLDWQIAGTGDFDGDNKVDILWRNINTGDAYVYLMNGISVVNEGLVRNVSTDWKIEGIDDFNGDNKSDILWRNTNTGSTYIYQMDGSMINNESTILTVSSNLDIAGTGDYNGDGNADILWRDSNGDTSAWLMNGFNISTQENIRQIANSWQIAAPTI